MPNDGASTTPSVNTVWVFLAVVIVVSGLIVYLVGSVMDNPDAAILSVVVPSLVAIGFTARAGRWSAVRQFLRLGGTRSISLSMVLFAALTVPLLALVAIGTTGQHNNVLHHHNSCFRFVGCDDREHGAFDIHRRRIAKNTIDSIL